MQVLVTGGTGFVGSHTAAALLEAGHRVRLLVRDPGKAKRIFDAREVATPECVRGDMTDDGAVSEALGGCDAVFHSAALVALEAGRAREVLESNARGVESVVGGACRAGIRSIVYVSSVSALFQPGGPPAAHDSPVRPGRTAYARSKAHGEEAVRRWQAGGAPIRTTYPTAVVGPDDPGLSESNHAIRTFLKDTMVMTSSGFQLVDVRDLAGIHVRLLERTNGPERFLVAGRYFPWSELADRIDGLTGLRVNRLTVPGALLRLGGRVGDWVKRVRPFDFPLTSEAMAFATRWKPLDDAETRAALAIEYRDVRETLADTLRWLVRSGHLTRQCIGRLAAEPGGGERTGPPASARAQSRAGSAREDS